MPLTNSPLAACRQAGYVRMSSISTGSVPSSGDAKSTAAAAASDVAPRVLSIQSSVVYGYVGNKSATFPLQVLGFDVDPINTCQFSNHTGYPKFRGSKLSAGDLSLAVEGLTLNQMFDRYSHVLTGYMAATPLVQSLPDIIRKVTTANPKAVYVCDPVLGDNGALYVPAEFVSLYRNDIIPLATIITPNQTEAELLSGMPIHSSSDAIRVCLWFHRTYPNLRSVIIKSAKFAATAKSTHATATAATATAATDSAAAELIHCIATTRDDTTAPAGSTSGGAASGVVLPTHYLHVPIPVLSGYFSGTGDLTSALLLARMHEYPKQLATAIQLTMNTLHAVLLRTAASGHSDKELLLVQSKRDIESPPTSHGSKPALAVTRYAIPSELTTAAATTAATPAVKSDK